MIRRQTKLNDTTKDDLYDLWFTADIMLSVYKPGIDILCMCMENILHRQLNGTILNVIQVAWMLN